MIRECSFEEISDGRRYGLNDMVKADTGNCQNCYKCCTGMGSSIVLDPFDIWQIKKGLNKTFHELLNEGKIELNMVDGLILPNIKMGEKDRCNFLNEEGRCSIHGIRPSICRLFPLGRIYEKDGFKYFLQKDECVKNNRAKIKVKKWVDTPNIDKSQEFIFKWHDFIRDVGARMIALRDSNKGERISDIAKYVLNDFYVIDVVGNNIDDFGAVYNKLIKMIDISKESIDKIS